ncbi:hypothetical protein QIJ20_gp3 [ssRNA phage SRR7976300_7]|uniref:Uncharacterized protein n=1 Tax=ssRNA phage SRR7976300_7 TaxID=2786656 RepID=A0A8S5L4R5_9VIRU|nr:hypothetical protein QIJ20_gp3 [ssRNA phage SRR7976300_7]DAD52673.1 TPA_asm: hypothetical protein [ssRNA phage SRR7976300_7]
MLRGVPNPVVPQAGYGGFEFVTVLAILCFIALVVLT